MKTIVKLIVFCVLFSCFSNLTKAQEVDNPQEELIENDWYLTKMVLEEEELPFIPNDYLEQTILFVDVFEENNHLSVDSCEWGITDLYFTDETHFITSGGLGVLSSDDDEDCDWDYHLLLFEDFWGDTDYEYTITQLEENQELVIENSNGDRTYYQDVPYMSVSDQQKSNLTLYPNPVKDHLYIENLTENVQLEIYDLSGKKLFNQEINNSSESVNVSQLSEGIYLYQLSQNGKDVKTGKLVKN